MSGPPLLPTSAQHAEWCIRWGDRKVISQQAGYWSKEQGPKFEGKSQLLLVEYEQLHRLGGLCAPRGPERLLPFGVGGHKENSFTKPQTASLYGMMSEMPWIWECFVVLIYTPSFSILNAHSFIFRRCSPTVLMEEHAYRAIRGIYYISFE